MTTKHSPLAMLQGQAKMVAAVLKQAERGDAGPINLTDKVLEARKNPTFKTGLVMDDKVITIELPWTKIAETTEPTLAEYILDLMRESRGTEQ